MEKLRQRDREVVQPLLYEEVKNNADDLNIDTNSSSSSSRSLDDVESHQHHQHKQATTCCSNFSPGSISNLCSATLGAGALSLPYAISLTGIIFGVLFLLISAYLTMISIDIIIEACVATQLYNFEDVSKRLVGSSLSVALEASLLVFCFGTAVAYIVAVGDILDQGFHSITFLWEPGSTFVSLYSRERVMILFWTVLLLPLSLQTKLKRLEKFSSLGVLSIIFLVIAAVIHSIIHGDVIGQKESTPVELSSLLWPKSFVSMLQAFPIIIFAFSCQVNVCQIFEELKPATSNLRHTSDDVPTSLALLKSKQQMMKDITRNGILLCMSLYLLIGVLGFLDFTKTTADDILINYCIQVTHDALMTAANFSVFVAVVVAFPFNILPARVTLKLIFDRLKTKRGRGLCSKATNCLCLDRGHRIDGDTNSQRTSTSLEIDAGSSTQSDARGSSIEPLLDDQFPDQSSTTSVVEHVFITLFLSGGALIVALLVPGISIVFGLMGGTAASIISFIVPGMFTLKMKEQSGSSTRVGKLFVWGGLVIGILTTGTTLYGVFNKENAPDGSTCK